MTQEQLRQEMQYQLAMSLTRKMLGKGLLTPDDIVIIDTMLRAKHQPLFGSLYPLNPLLYKEDRGNMHHTKGESE